MNKDEQAWTAMIVPTSESERDGFVGYAVKRMSDKLALGLFGKLSDGKEYAVKMMPPQTIPDTEHGTSEIRTAMSMREIVRCKDCVCYQAYAEFGVTKGYGFCVAQGMRPSVEEWFCADGERAE